MQRLRELAAKDIDGASSAVFRILFGLVLCFSTARFVAKGWIESLYLAPTMHFTYPGFEWVRVLPAPWMYAVFVAMGLAALMVTLGLLYRASIALFFVLFTYVELIDAATYLNHYYLVSLLAGLMCFLPLASTWSVDAWWAKRRAPPDAPAQTVPAWVPALLRFQIGAVYVFAGLAKVRYDWLVRGEPLTTWLRLHAGMPVVGPLLDDPWVAVAASWMGCIFDLCVPFALLHRRTRPFAYAAVVFFHLATGALFPIGVFPIVMIALTTIFFPPEWPRSLFAKACPTALGGDVRVACASPRRLSLASSGLLIAYALAQLAIPLRHHLYAGDTVWTEEGYRFSWRVMLVDKTGQVDFIVESERDGRVYVVHPHEYLTPMQAKMMATQPDMIWELAQRIGRDFEGRLGGRVRVRADSWATLNGGRRARLVDPSLDLLRAPRGSAICLADRYAAAQTHPLALEASPGGVSDTESWSVAE